MNKQKDSIDCKELINEMKQMVHKPKLTLESMIFSGMDETDDNQYGDEFETEVEDKPQETDMETKGSIGINGALNKIRQISLEAIAKLADNPTSEEYQILKKIWNTVDKAFESKKTGSGEI